MTHPHRLACKSLVAAEIGVGPASARAAVIYDATGGAENGGNLLSAAGLVLADRFVAGAAASLSSVTLDLPPCRRGKPRLLH